MFAWKGLPHMARLREEQGLAAGEEGAGGGLALAHNWQMAH